MAYLFNGYWEDIGTIESFFESNINLTRNVSWECKGPGSHVA